MEQKMSTNIKVAIRIRPLIAIEQEKKLRPQWGTQNNIIYQVDENGQKSGELYSFDHIFGMNKTNSEIYNDVVKDFVITSLDGLNSTIFAYGQTSSGKTYTMLGDKKDTGVMSLAIENIFNIIENNKNRKYLLRVSYMEIYNEKINDLLDPNNKDVKIREFYPATIGLQNIKEEIVSAREQMYDCLKRGNLNRHIGSTKANERSSRSHTIFRIMIESTQVADYNDSSGCVQVSNLNLVDLAGSERVAQTKATGMRLKEGGHINKSLSALGLVIRQLSDGQEFVNFRDSKLTRLLQDSLGGNSKTLIIATITLASIEDTCSTLAFAQRAKAVKNKPQVNEILADADVSKRYATLNTQLKRKLEEQLIINKKLQQTHEENIREMTRLQQQMEMLEDFQGKRVCKVKNTPKRRHTIGFSTHKLFSTVPPAVLEKGNDDEDLQDITLFEDLLTRETSRTVSTLETIKEEDTAPPNNKLSTPETLLRTRLSVLEEQYDELVTYTRDEDNIYKDTTKKIQKLENQLQSAQKKLLDYQNDQKCERELLEEKFKRREQDLCARISELEEKLETKGKTNMDSNEENIPNKTNMDSSEENIPNIMDQLICLQDILNNSDFLNGAEEIKGEDSVLQIIEQFNLKVKTSKDIIEKEILKQISNFDQSLQEEIIIPNELASFNELLNELSHFETDIPVDLINNMRKEGVEDLKILIKVYESLLRKNELLGRCSEKIKSLEDQRVKTEMNNNELKTEILNQSKVIDEAQQNCDALIKQEMEDKIKENQHLLEQINNLKNIIEINEKDMNNLKANVLKLMQDITQKDETLSELEKSYTLLKQENYFLKEESSTINSKYRSLKNENDKVKSDNETYCNKIIVYQSEINELSAEILEKSKIISERDESYENLKQILEDNIKENQDMLEQINTLKRSLAQLDDLNSNSVVLMKEITEKNHLIKEIENKCAILEEENQQLKKESSENLSLKNEYQNQISIIASEIVDKNKRICELENTSQDLTQEVEKLKKEKKKLLVSNESYEKGLNDLKNNFNQLNTEILKREEETTEIQKSYALLKEEKEKLLQQLTNNDKNKKSLFEEIEQIKNMVESQNKKIQDVNLELRNKNKIVEEFEINCTSLKKDKEKLKQELSRIYSENQLLKKEIEKSREVDDLYNKRISSFKNEVSKLSSDIFKKSTYISQLEQKCTKLEQEISRLKDDFTSILSENKTLQNDMMSLKKDTHLINKLDLQISEKEKIVCEVQQINENLISELGQMKQESGNILSENKHLKNEIEKLKNLAQEYQKNTSINGQTELKVQRLKQLLNNAQTEISDLKLALKEKEKLKCEISQYKCQLLHSNRKQEELSKIKEQQDTQINELREKFDRINEANVSLDVAKEQEMKINELQSMVEKFEDVLSSIIEQFINEQKTLLLIRHSQDERDYFKSILKDVKACNVNLKKQVNMLRNRSEYDLSAITTNLLKSRETFKEYSSSEKSLMQKQIDQLETNNKAYLQEIMAIKEVQCDSSDRSECAFCNSLKMELSKLSKVTKLQEETLESLKNKNILLGKENADRMKHIVSLQAKIYEEQDRKADIQYTDFLKFYQENDKMQQKQIQTLQEKIQEYQNAALKNKQSVEVQCDIIVTDSQLQEKYNTIKDVCKLETQKIFDLESEVIRLKNGSGIKIKEQMNGGDLSVKTASIEVQCDIIDMQKYILTKKVCQQRREQILALQNELAAFK